MESWEFGRTVRRWRDRLAPETVGIPIGNRRRATGLRREELAGLASISVDYLTRLEQGRATSPSAQVLESLARALRLSDVEREHLYRLAGLAPPGLDVVSSRVVPSLQRLLDRMASTPVVVYDAAWYLIVANSPYHALMGDTTAWRGLERNNVWRQLIGPGTRAVHTPQEHQHLQTSLVADLRLTAARYPKDRRVDHLVRELRAQSPRFVELWESSDLPPPRDRSRHKTIDHPAVGHLTLDCDTLIDAGDDIRITIYTAEPGTDDADRLALAIIVGTQDSSTKTGPRPRKGAASVRGRPHRSPPKRNAEHTPQNAPLGVPDPRWPDRLYRRMRGIPVAVDLATGRSPDLQGGLTTAV